MAAVLCSQARMEVRADAENGDQPPMVTLEFASLSNALQTEQWKKMAPISKIHFIGYEVGA